MKDLVERYIYDVVRRLPEGERAGVERELASNIADMLPNDSGEDEVVRVLSSLGEPRKLAEQYRENPRYLISPAMFEQYLAAIRIVLPVAAVAMGILGLVLDIAKAGADSFVDAIVSALAHALSAAITALFTTTLGFALADHYQFKGPSRPWSPRDLPQLPPKAPSRIPRGETIAGMVFSVVFIACLFAVLRSPWLIGWHGPQTEVVPLFMPQALARFAPWLALVALMSLAVSCVKLALGRWTYALAGINTAYGLVSAAVLLLFLLGADTFNPDFAVRLAQVLTGTPGRIAFYGRLNLFVIAGLIALVTAVDIGLGWYKAHRGRRSTRKPASE